MIRSSHRCALAAVVLCLGIASAATAQQEFRWKFEQGEQLDLVISQQLSLTSDLEGGSLDTSLESEIGAHWEVLAVDDDGTAKIAQRYDRLRVSMDSPFGHMEYDSESEEEPVGDSAEVAKQIEPLLGQTLELTINPHGEVVDITVPEEAIEAFAAAGRSPISEEGTRQLLSQSLIVFPEEAIEKGAEWERQFELPAALTNMKANASYTYGGEEQQDGQEVSVFHFTTTMEVASSVDSEEERQPELSNQDGSGYVWFDRQAGRVLRSSMDQSFEMDATIADQPVHSNVQMNSSLELTPVRN